MNRLAPHQIDAAGLADGSYALEVAGGKVTGLVAASGGSGGGLDAEGVRDTVAAALVAGTNVTITPDDAADTITIAADSGDGGGSAATYGGPLWPIDDEPVTANAMDDEFAGSSLDAKWTLTHATATAPTIEVTDGLLCVDLAAEAGFKLQGITQPLPTSGDWQFTLAVAASEAIPADFRVPAALMLAEGTSGTTGRIQYIGLPRYTANATRLEIVKGNSWSAWYSNVYVLTGGAGDAVADAGGYLRVTKVGTSYTWAFSRTGRRFFPLHVGTPDFVPGRVAIAGKSESAEAGMNPQGIYKWFRRTA